jgi:hypothetical protein
MNNNNKPTQSAPKHRHKGDLQPKKYTSKPMFGIQQSMTTYKNMQVVTPTPTEAGGLALNTNFKALADQTDSLTTGLATKADASSLSAYLLKSGGGLSGALSLNGNSLFMNNGSGTGGGLLNLDGGTLSGGTIIVDTVGDLTSPGSSGQIAMHGNSLFYNTGTAWRRASGQFTGLAF